MKKFKNLEKFKALKTNTILGGTEYTCLIFRKVNGSHINSYEEPMTREGMFEYKDKRGG